MEPYHHENQNPHPPCASSTPSFGLALGGGAILGLAHVGVLEALTSQGLMPDVLTGTSIGALVAACQGGAMSISDMKEIACRFSWKNVRKRKILPTMAVFSSAPMADWLEEILPCKDFDSLRTPVGMVSTDLRTCQMVVLGGSYLDSLDRSDEDITFLNCPMIDAIRASCTVPVIFEPVEIGGRILVDGFLTNNVPAGLARWMGADVVVAVDLQKRRTMYENPSNIIEYTRHSQMIYRYWAVKNRHIWADVVIHPELSGFEWDDTARISDIIVAGREATLEKLPEIEAALERFHDASVERRLEIAAD